MTIGDFAEVPVDGEFDLVYVVFDIICEESRPFRVGRNRVTDRDASGSRCTP